MGYLFIALRECCGVGAKTMFKVKDIHSAGSYAGIEILASDTNGVTKPSQSDLEAKFDVVKSRENFVKLRKKRDKLLVESDWSQGGDVPVGIKTTYQTYRQELRDLPSNSSKWTMDDNGIVSINWPTSPS